MATPADIHPAQAAREIVAAAEARGLSLRVAGGVGVYICCPSAAGGSLRRDYQDIDMVGLAARGDELGELLIGLGYEPEAEFNALHGHQRLFFFDRESGREIDVFLDGIEACHHLDLRGRLDVPGPALAPADLLLSKLQVVETNEKDFRDAIALFADHELTDGEDGISRARLEGLCGSDWGWWRTVTSVAEKVEARARELAREDPALAPVPGRVRQLIDGLEEMPKTRRWKMRARVGERKRWYELPEDVEHAV